MKFKDLTGQVFGRLMVVAVAGRHPTLPTFMWQCKCSCGTIPPPIRSATLTNGNTKSCGCLKREKAAERARQRNFRHGHKYTPEYVSFSAAKNRCNNQNDEHWVNYGGRGIEFRFKSFDEFFAELGPRPDGMSVDRKDNDGHYEVGNVRWATPLEQRHNQRI